MAARGVKFFLDNNLSPKIARALHHLREPEHSAHHLQEHFAANTPDTTWIAALAAEPDWIIISGDLRISRNAHEFRAWQEAGHPMFFLNPGWRNLVRWEFASKLFHRFPDIIKRAEKANRGDGFVIPVSGAITKLQV